MPEFPPVIGMNGKGHVQALYPKWGSKLNQETEKYFWQKQGYEPKVKILK